MHHSYPIITPQYYASFYTISEHYLITLSSMHFQLPKYIYSYFWERTFLPQNHTHEMCYMLDHTLERSLLPKEYGYFRLKRGCIVRRIRLSFLLLRLIYLHMNLRPLLFMRLVYHIWISGHLINLSWTILDNTTLHYLLCAYLHDRLDEYVVSIYVRSYYLLSWTSYQ